MKIANEAHFPSRDLIFFGRMHRAPKRKEKRGRKVFGALASLGIYASSFFLLRSLDLKLCKPWRIRRYKKLFYERRSKTSFFSERKERIFRLLFRIELDASFSPQKIQNTYIWIYPRFTIFGTDSKTHRNLPLSLSLPSFLPSSQEQQQKRGRRRKSISKANTRGGRESRERESRNVKHGEAKKRAKNGYDLRTKTYLSNIQWNYTV